AMRCRPSGRPLPAEPASRFNRRMRLVSFAPPPCALFARAGSALRARVGRSLSALAVAGMLLGGAGNAHAGRQQYEPLTDAVRTALAAAVSDDRVGEARYDGVLEKVDWLAAMSTHLPRRWKPDHRQRVEFLDAV